MVQGFRQVPYNDLDAMQAAISPATVAILIEGIQGEGGVTPATPEYLLGLRKLCDEKKLLLMMDSVQCGHFRSGRFQSYQRILENTNHGSPNGATFLPDAISMAKSLGGGFPMGAFWVRAPYADLLGAGTHGTTYGGSPLACAVGLKVLEVIEREKLESNAREVGDFLMAGLLNLKNRYPHAVHEVRGLGLMLGLELSPELAGSLPGDPAKSVTVRFTNLLHAGGLLVIPAGTHIIRLLPALNLGRNEAQEGLGIIEAVIQSLKRAS
jgi:acetylornithine aminotransferase/acetylornithine/N-succinyldiaminopimelate aminotransferase